MIQNYRELAQSRSKRDALKILNAGLEAAEPEQWLAKHITKDTIDGVDVSNRTVHLVAFGKSADRMASITNNRTKIASGIIVIPKRKSSIHGKKFQVYEASHPTPDQTSVVAAKSVIKFLKGRKSSEFVVFLVSGGGSSLLCMPDGIDLSDKMFVNDLLLKSGATIQEFNCVRKHLSKIKGGRLVENLRCTGVAFVMSDVVGDDQTVVASGSTNFDKTTFKDAMDVLKKYHLVGRLPEPVLRRLKNGISGIIPETPKVQKIPNRIIATNKNCTDRMVKKANELGYGTDVIQISGDIKKITQRIKKRIPSRDKSCLIFGGETTVNVIGNGKGGRNQEIVLRLLKNLQRPEHYLVSSMGTDGIDGNTEFAGALIENFKIDQDTIDAYLKRSDSSSFFAKYGGLIKTGHTGTNLMDVGIILR